MTEEIRTQILDAAEARFRTYGFGKTTMAEIASDIDMSTANLYRYFECFIGGSVAIEKEGVVDCAEGAKVTLIKDSKEIQEATTDNYGDFKFDRLEEGSGNYIVEINLEGHEKKVLELDLKESLNLGTILV